MTRPEAILVVDWLNLSISLKKQQLAFGAELVADLMKVAHHQTERTGSLRLARAHCVAETFSTWQEAAIERHLIAEVHKTRTVKEQAALLLAVIAMDHIHDDAGCPELFVLATGDQDFVPLIQRIVL